jgi:protocatechuate 3,4-dioxygenase, beta subunit
MRRDSAILSRRRFVAIAPLAMGALAGGLPSPVSGQSAAPRETADLVTGPYYPLVKPRDTDADLTVVRGRHGRAAGQVVHLGGHVMNLRGEPVRNAPIEVWQANARGRYTHPSDPNRELPLDPEFEGYARLRTDRDGRYRITTIKPGPYPTARGDMRAPHIHFQIDGRTDRKVTQLFFPGERLNELDRHLNSVRRPETLLASLTSPSGASEIVAEWNIILTRG